MMKLVLSGLAATALLAACGDDDAKSADGANSTPADSVIDSTPIDSTPADTTAIEPVDSVDPAAVRVYTSAEVCALVSQDVASSTLGVDVSEVETSELSTPQCSYNFTTDGVSTNLTLAVQRPIEDLGGAAGQAGFEVTTSFVIFDTPYEPLEGVGDKAAVSASETLAIVAVLANGQVFTIATSAGLDVANLAAFANEVVANIS